ncbi:hypothetical protein CEXT_447141 [Caerostris extrusa]|uniref:Uncharacterized protein n=1 Tax=Caerostris extrusa TaxID=172846 RepID=A0AAV4Y9I3_CAEEX|nr:hypothetical protein CEXT_447141 [Caerostris extrusa]
MCFKSGDLRGHIFGDHDHENSVDCIICQCESGIRVLLEHIHSSLGHHLDPGIGNHTQCLSVNSGIDLKPLWEEVSQYNMTLVVHHPKTMTD